MSFKFLADILNRQRTAISCYWFKANTTRYLVSSKRYLLTKASSKKPEYDIIQARNELRNIVGSSKIWGKERDPSITAIALPSSQDEMPKKRMLDSYREVLIPLRSKPEFKSQFVNFFNTVRVGRILESLDTMAVWIGYTHNSDPSQKDLKSPLSIVTAFVDNIALKPNAISEDADILIRGHVTWAGQTSMQIKMNVEQEDENGWREVLDAKFLMVARDPRNVGKAFVCPLVIETAEEQALFDEGEECKKLSMKQAQESLLKTPPNESERMLIHNLFLNTLDPKAGTFRRPKKPDDAIWMENTKLKNLIICFPEQRNLYNKIFGGFLMRVAYELGWTVATVYCKSRGLMVVAMDDIMFRKPVEIGSLLYLSSEVVFTYEDKLQVRVHAQVVDSTKGSQETTNVFHFTFQAREGTKVPTVIPNSYAEYMMYLDGRRHFLSHNFN